MLIFLWKKTKVIPHLQEVLASMYYFYYGTRINIRGKNNIIKFDLQRKFPFIQHSLFEITGSDNTIIINSGCHIHNTNFQIRGSRSEIIMEENSIIRGGCLWIDDSESRLVIGKGTTINHANIGVSDPKKSVLVGEDCMFAHGIDIRCGDSHTIIDLDSNSRINYAQDIKIGNHVWLAMNVSILKGVTIGNNSIIGSGSIVTKDIPENCIAVGVPADIKRTGVTWIRKRSE